VNTAPAAARLPVPEHSARFPGWLSRLAGGGVVLLVLAGLGVVVGGQWQPSRPQGGQQRSFGAVASLVHTTALRQASAATLFSSNWAGYVATQRDTVAVSGTWNVPSVRWTARATYSSVWVGIGGFTTNDLIQVGTESDFVGGRAVYYAWVEALPGDTVLLPLAVWPGNTVTASISYNGWSRWSVRLRNLSSGRSTARTLHYRSSLSSAEWIEEAPSGTSGVEPLARCGSVYLRSARLTAGGRTSGLAGRSITRLVLVDTRGASLLLPSALYAWRTAFTVWRTS
jgi:hypothetical protein